MGKITLTKKVSLGDGNYEYHFDCTCVPKPVTDIVVTYGNDNEARQDAQQQCDDYCK